jgi:hypothetical protein
MGSLRPPWVHSEILSQNTTHSQAMVAHTCNPSYSGGRDPEDGGSKPAWAKCLWDPISKKTHHKKKGWWSCSRCRPWVQTLVLKHTHTKREKEERERERQRERETNEQRKRDREEKEKEKRKRKEREKGNKGKVVSRMYTWLWPRWASNPGSTTHLSVWLWA